MVLSSIALMSFVVVQSSPQQGPVTLIDNVRIVAGPGKAPITGDILMRGGKIVEVAPSIELPSGAERVDGEGLTAYPGFIHPFHTVSVSGIGAAPAPAGGQGGQGQGNQNNAEAMRKRDADPFNREGNLLSQHSLKDKDIKAGLTLDTFSKVGYGYINLAATGGLVGVPSHVYALNGEAVGPKEWTKSTGYIGLRLSPRGGGGGGGGNYPSSAMGAIAFVRQALYDAKGYRPDPAKPDLALENLSRLTSGATKAVFEDLTEVTFFQAMKVSNEFNMRPVIGFRQDAGALINEIKNLRASVMLSGRVPTAPSLTGPDSDVNIVSVRSYFNELQAAAELEKNGIPFAYAPNGIGDPLEGIRTYVRGGLSKSQALAAMTTVPSEMLGISDQAGTLAAGKDANVVLVQGDLFDSSSQVMGSYVRGVAMKMEAPKKKEAKDLVPDKPLALMKPNYNLFPAPAETMAAFRLFKGATVWTMGKQGVLRDADVLIRDGKIVAVGKGLSAPAGAEVIDAKGKHIAPGIWDCHSHTGISGGVNDGTNMISAECRIEDVTDHRASSIYLQLSGGTVGANQLHGSANAIGGQSWTVKWRWGLKAPALAVDGAPAGIKFALGQNPIREDTGGFGGQQQAIGSTLLTFRPRTRMGVEEAIRRAFNLAVAYNQEWDDFRAGKTTVAPRRDLQLEAVGELIKGKRWVHSHGYRSDEMLTLLRICQEYGVKLATLQHVLEGFKIADEMAAAGVGGSTFSDWWGYKLEAYDAIPHNATLMALRGVSTSINSDSDNHARRLNQEAAKAIRYGGASSELALSFVTIEPCKQLGIDKWTGSIEVGKDADIAIWTAEPLSIFSVCEATYVDGVKRFDRKNDMQQRAERLDEIKLAREIVAKNGQKLENTAPADVVLEGTPSFGLGGLTSQPGTARYPRTAVLIAGATVHPMDAAPFVGDVLIGSDGKIVAVGKGVNGRGAARVDGRGKHVYPGLIDPVTGIGLNEIGQVPASDDSAERGNFHPDYRVERVLNHEWETLAVARNQGVLTALVRPAGSGLSGQAALIHTEGFTWEDVTILGGAALNVSSGAGGGPFGDNGFSRDDCCDGNVVDVLNHEHDEDEDEAHRSGLVTVTAQGGAQAGVLGDLSKRLDEAKEYRTKRAGGKVARDDRMEALLKVADGKLPVLISTNSASDMKQAVAWSAKSGVRVVLYGCAEAETIADWLAANKVPIILTATYSMPRADQPVDFYYGLAGRLAKAGVLVCLSTNNDKDVRQLRDQAGWAAAYGLGAEEGAKLITWNAAKVLGIDNRMGAIKPGLDGTVILTDGEIVETKTQVLRAWIQGREVDLQSRQTRLYDRYNARPMPKKT